MSFCEAVILVARSDILSPHRQHFNGRSSIFWTRNVSCVFVRERKVLEQLRMN